MKKLFAVLFAAISGFYLLALGWIPDPVPFVDEGIALFVFLNSLAALGLDLRRFIGFGGNKAARAAADTPPPMRQAKGSVVDSK